MAMAKKSIEDIDLKGKRVLLRIELEGSFENATDEPHFDKQIIALATQTIEFALAREAKSVVLLVHAGRPDGLRNDAYSLAPAAKAIEDLLGRHVLFIPGVINDKTEIACADPPVGTVILLDNLYFHAEERCEGLSHDLSSAGKSCGDLCLSIKPRREDIELFRGRLDALGDIYVNDAFASMHFSYSSIVGVDLPEMVLGLAAKRELEALKRIVEEPCRPLLAIVGGKDVLANFDMAISFARHANVLVLCGDVALTYLNVSSRDSSSGNHNYNDNVVSGVQRIDETAKHFGCEVVLPVDWVCGKSLGNEMLTNVCDNEQRISSGWMAMDCGPRSIELFVSHIFAAKTLFWSGLAGHAVIDAFSTGTQTLLDAIASVKASGGFTFLHGRDLVSFVEDRQMQDTISFVSHGGDASLHFLVHKRSPGIDVLTDKPRTQTWQGTAAGKYSWEENAAQHGRRADEDMAANDRITTYSWADGKKRVSIYLTLDGVDDLAEDAFQVSTGSHEVTLVVVQEKSACGKKRTFQLAGLLHEILGAKVSVKKGKNTLSLHLQKKDEVSWPTLCSETPRDETELDDA